MSKTKMWPTHQTFKFIPELHTDKGGGEITVQPGMAQTIPEIIKRAEQGQQIMLDLNLPYGDENLNPMYKPGFDLTDLDIIRNNIDELQGELDKKKNIHDVKIKLDKENKYKQKIVSEHEQKKISEKEIKQKNSTSKKEVESA